MPCFYEIYGQAIFLWTQHFDSRCVSLIQLSSDVGKLGLMNRVE